MAKKKAKPAELAKSLLAADFVNLRGLAEEMAKMQRTVEQFPEGVEYTSEDIDALEEARHQALKLAYECEYAIKAFEGTT